MMHGRDDYLSQYLPDFDAAEKQALLQEHTREDLIEMLLVSYKNVRLLAKGADLLSGKLRRIQMVVQEPENPPRVDQPPQNFPGE